jgi:single-strand DNA-binding protein
MRSLASGKSVTTFTVATNEYAGAGKERSEFHNVVTWDRLAETCGRYLGKGQQVAVEGRIQTRTWDDDQNKRHWRTEIVAASIEMLSGRRKKDYQAERAADALAFQAGESDYDGEPAVPADEPLAEEPEAEAEEDEAA